MAFRPRLPIGNKLEPKTQRWIEDFVEKRPTSEVTYQFVAANTEERIRHKLGSRPTGYRVVEQDAPGSVYRDELATRNDQFFVYLKSSAAGLTVRLEIF